ncbi:hypothetical protein JMJ35_004421 [Cladonia borealis]|uniref:Fe2OG dioxygenase domain-containing protein n=1 Tax=Cladonia borealis TaxID=184061 RepID=A0AA39V8R5_9LECA|nr:hypothetical protein JMJ35_004421 [Cladonia borealis]
MAISSVSDPLPPLNKPTLPPFPTTIPTAPLHRISLSKLLSHDPRESSRLFTACKDLGFFYLDLRSTTPGDSLLADAAALFDVGEDFFNLPLEEKMKYDFSGQKSYFGYKGFGTAVIDRKGTRDRNEFYNISKNDILALSPPLPSPHLLLPHHPLLSSFIRTSHTLVHLLLSHLNTHLRLPPSTLQNLHRLHHLSGDQVRFVKAPPQDPSDSRTALGEHTDFGSITILFNRLGGLQVLPPGENAEWVYVRPLEGDAIVNLGDAMVKFTNGLLRSNLHRVVAPPGGQKGETRFSVVYFNRPEDEVLLRRRALGKRVGVFREEEWERGLGTERVGGRL